MPVCPFLYYGLCKPQIPHQQSLYIGASFFRLVARITTIITPPEESRPASTRLQRQHASTTPARVYNASTRLQRQHAPTTPTHFPSSTLSNLPVSAAATSLITIITDIPCDPTSLVPICIRTNPVTRLRADLPPEPTLR